MLGSGDDASISVREGATLISVDALVEGVHFRIPPFSPRSVGHKALAVALSDLAAMGAQAREAYVQLGVPEGIESERLLELADGIGALAAEHGVAVAGGDVTRSPVLVLALTVVGETAGAEAAVRRAGAAAGDVVAVTGELGAAAAGLLLLEHPELRAQVEPALADALERRQREPLPQLAAGRALAAAGANAMIDLSDGLGGDARHLAEASGVELRIELERLPLAPGVAQVAEAGGLDPLELAAGGGEDYELLAALSPGSLAAAGEAVTAAGSRLTAIGEAAEGAGVAFTRAGAAAPAPTGFDQLRAGRGPGAPA